MLGRVSGYKRLNKVYHLQFRRQTVDTIVRVLLFLTAVAAVVFTAGG
jgi:glycine betaine/choline ABC-type transport system substrate-binding protein